MDRCSTGLFHHATFAEIGLLFFGGSFCGKAMVLEKRLYIETTNRSVGALLTIIIVSAMDRAEYKVRIRADRPVDAELGAVNIARIKQTGGRLQY